MPKIIVEDKLWRTRLDISNRFYKEWAGLFKCDILEKYYEGHQWRSQENLNYRPYVINKVFETLEIKIAEFMPTFPKYLVESIPSSSEFSEDEANDSSTLKQDVLNALISNPDSHFVDEVELAYRDSFFRFGIIEVGYDADWILNPNVPKPLTRGQSETNVSGDKRAKLVKAPEEIPVNERIYFKRVNPKHFRIGGSDHRYLNRCGWVGYSELIYKEDLLAMKKLLNRDKIHISHANGDDFNNIESNDRNTDNISPGMTKIWHIWDLRSRMRLILLDTPCVTIYQRGLKRLNLFDIRPIKRAITDGFYPVPAVFNWLSPQDEINETREMLRAHRRRFVRKFQVIEGAIDDEEIEKFETGPDGAIIKVRRENALTPIDNADLGNALPEAMQSSADDLNRISGTSDQERGISDRGTATEANIIQNRGAVRENKERDRTVAWLARVGREILLTARDKFTLGIWVQDTAPEGENFLGTVNPRQSAYKWVAAERLNDNFDFKINVDVVSMSVTAQQDEKQHFLEFLGVLSQFPMIAFSPLLVKEAAYRCGYRNQKAIAELQKMALLAEMGRMQQLQAQAAPPPVTPPNGPAGQQIVAQQTPPTVPAIQKQLGNQLMQ